MLRGGAGRYLKNNHLAGYLAGIEMLKSAAAIAKQTYDEVFVGRFEDWAFESQVEKFDLIIAADVLEHMFNPWKTLERLRSFATSGGTLLVSLPNVRNLRVIDMLSSGGEWEYRGSGILDITHLRFFTLSSAKRMLSETGWRIDDFAGNPDPTLISVASSKLPPEGAYLQLPKLKVYCNGPDELVEFSSLQWFFKCSLQ